MPHPNKPSIAAFILTAVALSVWMVSGYLKSPTHFMITGSTMGTQYSIKYHLQNHDHHNHNSDHQLQPHQLKKAVESTLQQLNHILSTYDPQSEISRWNTWLSRSPMVVDYHLIKITSMAKQIHAFSNGAYDPTIGTLIDLWGFGSQPNQLAPPEPDQIEAARMQVGFDHLVIDKIHSTLQKSIPTLQLNLSSIAKGYAVDQLAELIDHRGGQDYLVEIGGELKAKGTNETGQHWTIGIEDPSTHLLGGTLKTLHLDHMSLASSGSYRNAFRYNNKNYSHIIDPSTGYPIDHNTVAVTVMSQWCVEADGLATALMTLGSDQGLKLAEHHSIAALFIDQPSHKDDRAIISTTQAWDKAQSLTHSPSR